MTDDAFKWLDEVIIQHKKDYVREDNNIQQLLKENLYLKNQNEILNEVINERDHLKELNELQEQQIVLLEKKVNTLYNAYNEFEKVKEEIYNFCTKIDCIGKEIGIGVCEKEINWCCPEDIKIKLCDIENYFLFLSQDYLRTTEQFNHTAPNENDFIDQSLNAIASSYTNEVSPKNTIEEEIRVHTTGNEKRSNTQRAIKHKPIVNEGNFSKKKTTPRVVSKTPKTPKVQKVKKNISWSKPKARIAIKK